MANMSMDDFNVGVTLGTGSFGRVRFAIEKVRSTYLFSKYIQQQIKKSFYVYFSNFPCTSHYVSFLFVLLCMAVS